MKTMPLYIRKADITEWCTRDAMQFGQVLALVGNMMDAVYPSAWELMVLDEGVEFLEEGVMINQVDGEEYHEGMLIVGSVDDVNAGTGFSQYILASEGGVKLSEA